MKILNHIPHCIVRYLIYGIAILAFTSVSAFAQKKEKSALQTKRDKVDISDIELRLRLTNYFIRFTEIVEEAADRIYYQSDDPEVRRAALMWKIYGISAMNKAVNMPDPIASFYNAWPLANQMVHFFESGLGYEKFGEHHTIALQASIDLEKRLDKIIQTISSQEEFERVEPGVVNWAREHPITDLYFTRESTIDFFAKWLGEQNFGIGRSINTITEQVVELSNRINIYTDLVPKQARWQVDLALINYLPDSGRALSRIDNLLENMDRITETIEKTPEVIEYNREATLKNIDLQRKESLELIVAERKAVIKEIRSERIDVINALIAERKMILDQLKTEREIVLDEINGLSNRVLVDTESMINSLINNTLWKITILIFLAEVVFIAGLLIYKKY